MHSEKSLWRVCACVRGGGHRVFGSWAQLRRRRVRCDQITLHSSNFRWRGSGGWQLLHTNPGQRSECAFHGSRGSRARQMPKCMDQGSVARRLHLALSPPRPHHHAPRRHHIPFRTLEPDRNPPSLQSCTTTMVSLTTSDNEQFTVDRDVAERSVLIKQMLEGESKPQGTIAISYSATT